MTDHKETLQQGNCSENDVRYLIKLVLLKQNQNKDRNVWDDNQNFSYFFILTEVRFWISFHVLFFSTVFFFKRGFIIVFVEKVNGEVY